VIEKQEELVMWWLHYRSPSAEGFAIGFLQQNHTPGHVALAAHTWNSGIGGVGFVSPEPTLFREEWILEQGPCIPGKKVTKEEHEKWLAKQKATDI
jgi:hypothetical protein